MTRKITVTFDLISNRQDLLEYMKPRKLGLDPYMIDRDDMFWAWANIKETYLEARVCYCIDLALDAEGKTSFFLSYQCGAAELNTKYIHDLVLNKWESSQEKQQALQWLMKLIQGGYYDHGKAYGPHTNAGTCIHCNHLFERGTSHPHMYIDDRTSPGGRRIIYHHGILQRKAEELGLKVGWISGFTCPSLEDQKILEPYIIQ